MPRKKNISNEKKAADKETEIKSLQEMIATAENTISSAKQMLSEIQRSGRSLPKVNSESPAPTINSDGQIIHGKFDGQIMIGDDGKQYPVPANYASKSKLVEGDMLKLAITSEGNFVYKQIGPVERKFIIGIAKKDDRGNYVIQTELKAYKVLLAAATYFKIEPGDEVTIVVPRNESAVWSAIENVVRKASEVNAVDESPYFVNVHDEESGSSKNQEDSEIQQKDEDEKLPSAIERLQKEIEEERRSMAKNESIADEWTPDIEQLKKEVGQPAEAETKSAK